MKTILQTVATVSLCLLSIFSVHQMNAQTTYTYVVEEFNFTNSVSESEDGFRWQQFNLMSEGDGTNEYNTVHKGYLRYEGDDETSERSFSTGITSGKIHVYLTLSSFNLEVEPTLSPATLGTNYDDGIERLIAVQLYESSGTTEGQNASSDLDIARLRLRADWRNSDTDPAMRIGGDNNQTASVGGYPFNFQKSDTAVTVGMTVDLDANTYVYWTNEPTEDDSKWFSTSSDRSGALTSLDGLILNEIELRLDHIDNNFGDGGETRNTANFLNFDRVLILHETTNAPASATFSSATEDNSVTISSNESTAESKRVQSLTIDAGTTLTVEAGHELTVIDQLVVNGTLIVKDGGSLKTYSDVTMGASGSFQKERSSTFSTTDGKYSVVGSPVSGATTASLGGIVYKYNESTVVTSSAELNNRFTPVTSAETMTLGDAYFSANTGDITFTGPPNTGNIDVSLVYTSSEGSDAGWNLVANPYPSAIELNSFVTANSAITGSIYLWDDGGSDQALRTNSDYVTVSASGTSTAGSSRSGSFDGYIRSEQGFFVQATSAGTLSFTETMKAGTTANTRAGYFREATDNANLFRVFLENDSQRSNMVIELNNSATNGFDRAFDAKKLNAGEELSIYSYMNSNNDIWAIQGISSNDLTGDIWLGIDIAKAGEYTLRFEDGIAADLYLADHLTGKIIDLQEVSSYTFNSAANKIGQKRFSISSSYANFSVLDLDDTLEERSMRAYFTESDLVILSKSGFENSQIIVHDLQGKLLYNATNISSVSREIRLPFKFQRGIVVINVINANSRESIKILK